MYFALRPLSPLPHGEKSTPRKEGVAPGTFLLLFMFTDYLFHQTQDNIVLNQLHFIYADCSVFFWYTSVEGIKKALEEFGCTSAILSSIEMIKENCITKEKYEEMYQTNEETEKRMDLSVGEDLETFIENIKNGKINKETIPEQDLKNTFLLCLLDKEERKKLDQKDYDFTKTFNVHYFGREPDVPEAEWIASESNMKFARSACRRRTYVIDASINSSDLS